jgi:hypothetical protein
MHNLGNVYIRGSLIVMSRIDAQNGVEIIFRPKFKVETGIWSKSGWEMGFRQM